MSSLRKFQPQDEVELTPESKKELRFLKEPFYTILKLSPNTSDRDEIWIIDDDGEEREINAKHLVLRTKPQK